MRGNAMSIEDVAKNNRDKAWLCKLAEQHTQTGTIWIHEETVWARNAKAAKRQKKA